MSSLDTPMPDDFISMARASANPNRKHAATAATGRQRPMMTAAKAVADFKGGKKTAIAFLMGQVMRETKGKANPKLVTPLLEEAMKQLPDD